MHLRHFREPVLPARPSVRPPDQAAVALQIFCKAAVRLGSVVAVAATAKTRARSLAAPAAATRSATAKFHFDSELLAIFFNYIGLAKQLLLKTRIRILDAFTKLESSTKGRGKTCRLRALFGYGL